MHFSTRSYMMAVLGGNCLICFLYIIMKEPRITPKLSIRFLRYFSLFILLRLLMPFEFFHTITVPSQKILPAIIDFCNMHIFFTIKNIAVTPSRLFLLIWLCGGGYIAYNTFRGYRELYSTIRCYPNLLVSNPGISAILTHIYAENPVPHPVKKVIRTQLVTTPCITGFFSPVVFLPDLDFNEEELYCILFHELSHLRHRDFLWKAVTEILCILNWWNPFVKLLKIQMADIIEYDADKTAYAALSPAKRILYLKCLLKVARNQHNHLFRTSMSLPFSRNTDGFLKYRILRLIEAKTYRSFTNFCAVGLAIVLLFLSTLFIIEPMWMPQEEKDGEVFGITENSYLLMQPDGSYDFYIDPDTYMGTIRNPDVEEIRDLPIYYAE